MDFLVLVKVPHGGVSGLVTLATILASFVCFAQKADFAKSTEGPFETLTHFSGCCGAACDFGRLLHLWVLRKVRLCSDETPWHKDYPVQY